ncbi:MAG TPA: DUF222 domain-containing protein [Acidimicrobiales bacterium]|nr:DUF222 domain-containing protein [Acidimicrobiales bacterium]
MEIDPEVRREAWARCADRTVSVVGTMNLALVELVTTIRELIDTEGWQGAGIMSVEHWVRWHACMGRDRARNLVRVAERMHELPRCWALFREGRLTEDAMVRIARRVPAERDANIAELAPGLLIAQLDRVLRVFPVITANKAKPATRERSFLFHVRADGTGVGSFTLPPDEAARLKVGLQQAREAEYRRRNGLDDSAEVTRSQVHEVTPACGFVRLTDEGIDALDPSLCRRQPRSDRTKVVLHHDVDRHGELGPGQLHLGATIPSVLARYLSCDAEVQVMQYRDGRLVGINPTARTVSRALRRAIERRDQGCAHPLCGQRVALHIHHIVFWENGGTTIPRNLIALCPRHHRALHLGELSLEGDPEAGTVVFRDEWGRRIEPIAPGSPEPLRLDEPTAYRMPYGERLDYRQVGWN